MSLECVGAAIAILFFLLLAMALAALARPEYSADDWLNERIDGDDWTNFDYIAATELLDDWSDTE